jgi:hypothetical protein
MFFYIDVRVLALPTLEPGQSQMGSLSYKAVEFANHICSFVYLTDGERTFIELPLHALNRDLRLWFAPKGRVPYPATGQDNKKQDDNITLDHEGLSAIMMATATLPCPQHRHGRACIDDMQPPV